MKLNKIISLRSSSYKLLILFMFVLGLSTFLTPKVLAVDAGAVGTWSTSSSTLPAPRSLTAYTEANGYMYVIAGWNGAATDTVYYAQLGDNGSVGSWNSDSDTLPVAMRAAFAVSTNSHIYVMGGLDSSNNRLDTVYHAAFNPDGSIGSWMASSNSLPQPLQSASAVIYNGYIYVAGGASPTDSAAVYYAQINNDGTIGAWTTNSNSLPAARYAGHMVSYNGYLYFLGGIEGGNVFENVYYAKINNDMSVGTWTSSANSVPIKITSSGAVVFGGYIYLIAGGGEFTFPQDKLYRSQIKKNGDISEWTEMPNALPSSFKAAAATVFNDYFFSFGGVNGSNVNQTFIYTASATAPTTVSEIVNNISGAETVLVTDMWTHITCSNVIPESSLALQDTTTSYPLGLVNLCFDTVADTNEVSLTFVTDLKPAQVVAKYFNSTTKVYSLLPSANITETTHAGKHALVLSYSISDNGILDLNAALGKITDPVGLALGVSIPNTGLQKSDLASTATIFLSGVIVLGYVSRRIQQDTFSKV